MVQTSRKVKMMLMFVIQEWDLYTERISNTTKKNYVFIPLSLKPHHHMSVANRGEMKQINRPISHVANICKWWIVKQKQMITFS